MSAILRYNRKEGGTPSGYTRDKSLNVVLNTLVILSSLFLHS